MASQVNGPTGMYKINSFFEPIDHIGLPTCMYTAASLHQSVNAPEQMDTIDSTDSALVELERRQEAILAKLETLRSKVNELSQKSGSSSSQETICTLTSHTSGSRLPMNGVIHDLVISANPACPPLSVAVLYHLLNEQYKVLSACHIHSSVCDVVSDKLKHALGKNGVDQHRANSQLAVTLIWKDVKHGPTLMVSPNIQTAIHGDGSVARYIARLLDLSYDSGDIVTATQIDQYVDQAAILINGSNKERAGVLRTLNGRLGKEQYLVGGRLSLADIVLWSAVHQSKQADAVPGNVKRWLDLCGEHPAFGLARKML